MAVSKADVQELAHLARLRLSDDETSQLTRELGSIFEYVAALAQVDTTGVNPMTQAVPLQSPLRSDAVEPSLSAELALSQAPDAALDLFQVPRIVDKG